MITFDDDRLKELAETFEKGMKAAFNTPDYTKDKETIVDGYLAAISMIMKQSGMIDQLNNEVKALRY